MLVLGAGDGLELKVSADAAPARTFGGVEPSAREDEALLREGGFRDVALFYVAWIFRGWIGYA